MGTKRPKRNIGVLLEELENSAKDAILEEETSDPVLKSLLELAIVSIRQDRNVFGLIDEPILWRKFIGWTRVGLDEAQAAAVALEKANEALPK